MDRDGVEVYKHAKKKGTRPILNHLDRTSSVNKRFIIWLLRKFFLRDTAGGPVGSPNDPRTLLDRAKNIPSTDEDKT